MHSQPSVSMGQRFINLSTALDIRQIDLIMLLGLSISSMARLKKNQLQNISIQSLKRVMTIDDNIVKYLLAIDIFSNPQRAYVPSETVRLAVHRTLGELQVQKSVVQND